MWKATKITADAANKMQINAGLLLNEFDISNPIEPTDEQIISDTTGDYSISLVPTRQDFFDGVNNAQLNMKEGQEITGWTGSLTITILSITEETLKLSLGAADGTAKDGIKARSHLLDSDFKKIFWIGDMKEETKLLVAELDNALSTGGFTFSSSNNGKGGISLTFTPFGSVLKPEEIPMTFYILEKIEE